MDDLTDFERAALYSIFSETPELMTDLEAQLSRASVVDRENTGAGFLTTFAVDDAAPRIASRVLGHETAADVTGLPHGVGLVLLMRDGHIHVLDCHAWDGGTSALDPFKLEFRVFRQGSARAD